MGEKFKPYKDYSEKMVISKAKPIQIIGDPDNQHPDKRSFTVF
jgi:hypothetical protein